MQRRFKIVVLVILCAAAALCLTACDGMVKTDTVKLKSIYTNDYVQLSVSADKYSPGGEEAGWIYYETKLGKSEALAEIEANVSEIKDIQGHAFLVFSGTEGLYYLSITDSARKGYKSTVIINDMSCSFNIEVIGTFPFPYFLFGQEFGSITVGVPYESSVDKAAFSDFVSALGIYSDVANGESSVTVSFNHTTVNVTFAEDGATFTKG